METKRKPGILAGLRPPPMKAIVLINVIGLLVVGIKLMSLARERLYADAAARAAVMATTFTEAPEPSAESYPAPEWIDELLPVAYGYARKATITSITREVPPIYSSPGISFDRIVVFIAMSHMSTQQELDAELCAAAREQFELGARYVKVIAHRPQDDAEASFASLTFAPRGEWDKPDRVCMLDEYQTKIYYNSYRSTTKWVRNPLRRLAGH